MVKKSVRYVERKINNVLYSFSIILTVIAMAMNLAEFFSRGKFPPIRMNFFYIGILTIYALHKEALRWLIEKEEEWAQKRGEYFFYAWIAMTTLFFVINFLAKDYFYFSSLGEPLGTLRSTAFTTLEVGAVFILARFLKITTARIFSK